MAKQIDSHHHLWRYNDHDYVWMSSGMSLLHRDYLPDELKANLEGAGIDGTVVVQARQSLEETRWLLEVASQSPTPGRRQSLGPSPPGRSTTTPRSQYATVPERSLTG
jgi:predicted TIM-barrel fold metal-dependent hydrolase